MADSSDTISTSQLVRWLAGGLVMIAAAGISLWISSVSGQITKLQTAFEAQHVRDADSVTRMQETLNVGLNELRKNVYEQALQRTDTLYAVQGKVDKLEAQLDALKHQLELALDRLGDLKAKKEER